VKKVETKETVTCDLCGKVARTATEDKVSGKYFFFMLEEHGGNTVGGKHFEKQICEACMEKIEATYK